MRSKPIKMYPIIKEMLVHEWYRNGDHPEDRTVNRLNDGRVVKRVSIEDLENQIKICPLCKQTADKHGILQNAVDGELYVCPGDYIETIKEGSRTHYRVHKRIIFDRYYNNTPPVEETIDGV